MKQTVSQFMTPKKHTIVSSLSLKQGLKQQKITEEAGHLQLLWSVTFTTVAQMSCAPEDIDCHPKTHTVWIHIRIYIKMSSQ